MKMYSRLFSTLILLCVSVPALSADKKKAATGMDRVYKSSTIKGTLATVLPKIAKMGDRRIVIDWAALERLGAKKDTKVSLKPKGASAGQILSLVLAQVAQRNKPLGWFEANKTVFVTSQMRAIRKDVATIRLTNATSAKGKGVNVSGDTPRRDNGDQVAWDKAELRKVLEYVRKAGNLNMVVNWKALEESGIKKTAPVSLKLRRANLATLLDLILEQVNGRLDKYSRSYWVIEKGIVKITTGDILNRKTVTRAWDITDLLHTQPDFEGPRMKLQADDDNDSGDRDNDTESIFDTDFDDDDDSDDDGQVTRKQLEEKVVTMIKDSIDRDMWKSGGGKGSIAVYQGKLIITQTQLGWKLLENTR